MGLHLSPPPGKIPLWELMEHREMQAGKSASLVQKLYSYPSLNSDATFNVGVCSFLLASSGEIPQKPLRMLFFKLSENGLD